MIYHIRTNYQIRHESGIHESIPEAMIYPMRTNYQIRHESGIHESILEATIYPMRTNYQIRRESGIHAHKHSQHIKTACAISKILQLKARGKLLNVTRTRHLIPRHRQFVQTQNPYHIVETVQLDSPLIVAYGHDQIFLAFVVECLHLIVVVHGHCHGSGVLDDMHLHDFLFLLEMHLFVFIIILNLLSFLFLATKFCTSIL